MTHVATPGTDGGAKLVLYCEEDGTVPVVEWMDGLPPRARARVFVRLERLAARWYALGPKETTLIRDGFHELSVRHAGLGYFVYYFRFGLASIVLVGADTRKLRGRRVPTVDVAFDRKRRFELDPRAHAFKPEPL